MRKQYSKRKVDQYFGTRCSNVTTIQRFFMHPLRLIVELDITHIVPSSSSRMQAKAVGVKG